MKDTIDTFHKVIGEIEDYAILFLDENGVVKDWNKGAEKLKGYKTEEIIGKNFRLFYSEEDRASKLPEKLIEKAITEGKASDEGWRVRKDGSKFWGSVLITALHDEKNKLTGFLKITRDLTERKNAEEKLKEANEKLESQVKERTRKIIDNEKRFRETLDNMLEGIQIHDFNWRYVYVNDALVKYSSYSKEELLGHTLMEKYPGIEQTDLFKTLQRCMNERVAEQMETEFVFPDGSKADFQLSIQPTPEGIFILSVDITERKRAEKYLQQNIKELSGYKFAIDESAIVARTDQKGIIQHVNENFCRISKYSEAELLGQDHRIINSAYHPKEYIRDLWSTIANGKIWKGELKNKAKDGTIYWVDTTIVPFLNDAGKPHQYLAIRSDITERKKTEEELLKANRLYAFISGINQSIVHIKEEQELLDKACRIAVEIGQFKMAWIGLLDGKGKLNMVSLHGEETVTKELGKYSGMDYSSALLRGTPTGRALSTGEYAISSDVQNDPAMLPWKEEHVQHEIKANISLPIKKLGRVTGIFGLNSTIEHYFDKQEIDLLLEAAGDISFALEIFEKEKLRKQSEMQLLQNEARLKKAQSIAHIGHWELNFATGIAEWSEESCRIYGLDPANTKQSLDAWISFIHPDDMDRVMKLLKEQRENLSPATFDHRIIRKDGTIRHIHAESKFEFDTSGKSIGLYGIIQDITEQKMVENEIRHLNETLEARVQERTAELTEANKDLEAFTGTVSHDLRAPARTVASFAQIIQQDYGHRMAPEEKELFGYIEDSGKRMNAIIDDLLKLAKFGNEKLKLESVDMTRLVQGIWLNISRAMPNHAELDLQELLSVQVDMSMMMQVVVNLLSNAVKYSSKKEKPLISVWCEQINENITFYFKDNGAGFDMKNYDRLFGAFQRFHSTTDFEGTGIGLTLVKRIIEKHGGTVGAEAKVDEGATFYFTIPLS